MVIKSLIPNIDVPEIGIIDLIFAKENGVPEDRELMIDVYTEKKITYAQLKDDIARFNAGAQDKFGFGEGDVSVIFAPNQIDYSVPLFGSVAAGGISSPANPTYTVNELVHQLEMTKAKLLIAHPSNVDTAVKAAMTVGLPKSNILLFGDESVNGLLTFRQALFSERRAAPVQIKPHEVRTRVAYLCFSSGTTGKSKGVMLTHYNMVANILQYKGLDSKFFTKSPQTLLGTIPFFHAFGLNHIVHTTIYYGVPLYVMPRFDLEKFCQTIEKYKITFTCLVPPMVLILAQSPIVQKYDLSSLKSSMCGAAPLGPDLVADLKAVLPNLTIKQGYGLTETSPAAILEPHDKVVSGSIGLLIPNMVAKIIDEEGKEAKQGDRGELWLKGPNIMKGYLNNPEATNECIDAEGYFHTGDVAIQNKEGHFFIVDRIKELIKFKGFQVPPAELEAILLKSPLVSDCAVIGVYDKTQATEIPRAYITVKANVPKNEVTSSAIKKFVADQVVSYKKIRSLEFIDVIPKSASGKILRRLLRDAAQKEQELQDVRAKL